MAIDERKAIYDNLWPCDNMACDRWVRYGTKFCCFPCAQAAAGKYEIDAHSEGCDARQKERADA